MTLQMPLRVAMHLNSALKPEVIIATSLGAEVIPVGVREVSMSV